GVEGDFYLSADGKIVCIHDKDTERVAGVKHVVVETAFAELRKLDVGAWKGDRWRGERIPTLEEVLETVPAGKKVFIELKVGPEIVLPLQRELAASSLSPEQIVIIAFNKETVAACEKLMPHLRSHWLTSYKEQDDGAWQPSAIEVATTVKHLGADGLGSKAFLEFVDKAFIDQFRAAGGDEFHVWTVNEIDVAKQYQQFGAWSITTDRPGWLRRQLHPAAPAAVAE
ncbi:MAG: glycerophosphodiester phosphodiesterase, partial [Planctomycetales bacterium]|nr:glycerophosphodiester phosphodiesterase [Planctomycetales bacterium]